MNNLKTIEEISQSLAKVLTLFGGAVHEIHEIKVGQAKAAANLLRICADRLDTIVDREMNHD